MNRTVASLLAAISLPLSACSAYTPPEGAPQPGIDAGPSDDPKCAGQKFALEGQNHVAEGESVTYATNPPTSGNHWGCWAPWGLANKVLRPERWVHNLEHGGVVLLYKCATSDGCPETRALLTKVFNGAPDAPGGGKRLIVTASSTLPKKVGLTAWGWSYVTDTPTEANLLCFIRAHQGMGPEDVASNPSQTGCPQSYE